jgi:hypothetical protein
MRTTTIGLAERQPRRSRAADPGHRRGELFAGLAAAVIVGQILFAQVTLLGVIILVAVGSVSRWRPHWLTASALASAIWLAAIGAARAAAAYVEGSRRLAAYILESAAHPGRLAHPAVAVAGAATWLPRQLPLALLAACGEAWLVLWLGWWRRESNWRWRPGLVAVSRRRVAAATLAAGHTVTRDGFALGVEAATGRLASVSWSEAARGVLLAGEDTDELGLAVVCAALRRRKTVLILDCPGQASMAGRISEIAGPLGVPIIQTGPGVARAAPDGAGGVADGVAGDVAGDVAGGVAGGVVGAVGRAIRKRETVLIATAHHDAASQAVAGLVSVLDGLRELGLRADCLAWIRGADCLEPPWLAELRTLGPLAGTAVVVSTTSAAQAIHLARETAVVVVSGSVTTELALGLAAPRPDTAPVRVPIPTGAGLAAGSRIGLSTGQPIGQQGGHDAPLWAADATSRPMESLLSASANSASRTITGILSRQHAGEFTVLAGIRPDIQSARVTANCRLVPITRERLR